MRPVLEGAKYFTPRPSAIKVNYHNNINLGLECMYFFVNRKLNVVTRYSVFILETKNLNVRCVMCAKIEKELKNSSKVSIFLNTKMLHFGNYTILFSKYALF